MAIVGLRELAQKQNGFYVPGFEILVGKSGLPGNIVRDVLQVTYSDNIKEIDGFEISVNNWDPEVNRFKYLGAENQLTTIFEPSAMDVTVRMGYAGDLRVMLTGNITTLEPNFPGSGSPTLTVRGMNVLHQLRTKQYSHAWTKKKDSEIARNIATLIDDQTGKKRFPLSIKTNPNDEPELDHVAQDNQYDIDFLLGRARQRGYVVIVQEKDAKVRNSEKQLYFGPSEEKIKAAGLDDIIALEWGLSLIDFKPTLTTANQIHSVTVRGWDRRTKKTIKGTATLDDLNLNYDLRQLLNKCNPREERVVDEPVFTRKQAQERAKALLLDRHKDMVKASGSTVGLPELRAGKRVLITGFGPRFSGTYFVTETTHTMDNSGYITRFQARREDAGEVMKV